jgi:hypothetical protein
MLEWRNHTVKTKLFYFYFKTTCFFQSEANFVTTVVPQDSVKSWYKIYNLAFKEKEFIAAENLSKIF